jgi:hypothetical protein
MICPHVRQNAVRQAKAICVKSNDRRPRMMPGFAALGNM